MPGPLPLPIVGNALPLLYTGAHHYLHRLQVQHGNVIMLWLGMRPFIVVNDLELVKQVCVPTFQFDRQVLQSNASSYRKGFFAEIMRPLMGEGLLTR